MSAVLATPDAPTLVNLGPLPKPANLALAFYSVRLKGQKGPTPVFVVDGLKQPRCPNAAQRVEVDGLPRKAKDNEEFERMQNPPLRLERDETGYEKTYIVRGFEDTLSGDKVYFEDPSIAAATRAGWPHVVAISLYCPARMAGPSGAMEDHGPYRPLGADTSDTGDEPGKCPKCAGSQDPNAAEIAAAKAILAHYQRRNKPAPGALLNFLSGYRYQGRPAQVALAQPAKPAEENPEDVLPVGLSPQQNAVMRGRGK